MTKPTYRTSLEHQAEMLRERIYATITLIAVFIGLKNSGASALHVLLTVIGTMLSLWAASLIATRLSRHIVMRGQPALVGSVQHHLRQHRALLAVAVLPCVAISLAVGGFVSTATGITMAMVSLHLPLLAWAFNAARFSRTQHISSMAAAVLVIISIVAVTSFKAYAAHL